MATLPFPASSKAAFNLYVIDIASNTYFSSVHLVTETQRLVQSSIENNKIGQSKAPSNIIEREDSDIYTHVPFNIQRKICIAIYY